MAPGHIATQHEKMLFRQSNFFSLGYTQLQCVTCQSWLTSMAEAAHHTLSCYSRSRRRKVLGRKNTELSASVQFNKTSARDTHPDENNPQPDFSFVEPEHKSHCLLTLSNVASPHDVLQPVEQDSVQMHLTAPTEGIPWDAKQFEKHLTDANPHSDNKKEIMTDPANQSIGNSESIASLSLTTDLTEDSKSVLTTKMNLSNLSVQVTAAEDIEEQTIQCWDYLDEDSSVVINFTEECKAPHDDSIGVDITTDLASERLHKPRTSIVDEKIIGKECAGEQHLMALVLAECCKLDAADLVTQQRKMLLRVVCPTLRSKGIRCSVMQVYCCWETLLSTYYSILKAGRQHTNCWKYFPSMDKLLRDHIKVKPSARCKSSRATGSPPPSQPAESSASLPPAELEPIHNIDNSITECLQDGLLEDNLPSRIPRVSNDKTAGIRTGSKKKLPMGRPLSRRDILRRSDKLAPSSRRTCRISSDAFENFIRKNTEMNSDGTRRVEAKLQELLLANKRREETEQRLLQESRQNCLRLERLEAILKGLLGNSNSNEY